MSDFAKARLRKLFQEKLEKEATDPYSLILDEINQHGSLD
ncbi:MAG: hypothetical protein OFPII_43320 [Osedax symbiont Rs1]|nr:MAG: hypothetical protein OFPII_43320 [Osedax symbiont Rs1]